jgi:hypothetical protein
VIRGSGEEAVHEVVGDELYTAVVAGPTATQRDRVGAHVIDLKYRDEGRTAYPVHEVPPFVDTATDVPLFPTATTVDPFAATLYHVPVGRVAAVQDPVPDAE